MDELSRSILQVFDELGRDTLDLHALLEVAGGNDPARRDSVVSAVELLERGGSLELTGGADFYRRTEQGRLAVAKPLDVTLYSRPKCKLCDEAREAVEPILREFGSALREVNIDEDKKLRELYTNDVPVIFLGSKEIARHNVDTVRFRQALEKAGSKSAAFWSGVLNSKPDGCTSLSEQGLVGRFRLPSVPKPYASLLVLGGAEGGLERADEVAQELVKDGFATLALAYFGVPSLPAMLEEIPLEYFHKAIEWMQKACPGARLGVVGGSKGGEAALLISATCKIDAVVAYVPSHVAWQALNWQPPARSSWQHRGSPVPFVRYVNASERMHREGLRGLYAASLEADPIAAQAAEIPVEQAQGAVLVISGGKDGIWPSSEMARSIVGRLRTNNFSYPYQHLDYPDAGHAIMGLMPAPASVQVPWGELRFGGTDAANAAARTDAWKNVLRFLREVPE